MRISGLLSEVATTTTERAMPSGPRSFSINSRNSLPRSPTSPMTLTSALVLRAIMPMSVDFPTPDPAMMPTRWPLPRVRRPFIARTPTSMGSQMRGRSMGSGAGAKTGLKRVGKSGSPPSRGVPKASMTRPR